MSKLKLLLRTALHLKPVQIRYQLWYRLKRQLVAFKEPRETPAAHPVGLLPGIPAAASYQHRNTFRFLNLRHTFKEIDWNYSDYGKLWTYNLNYFEFLNQSGMEEEEGLRLMVDFLSKKETHKEAYEPYPVSLRIINWVKFLSYSQPPTDNRQLLTANHQLYSDCIRLSKNSEYHLLANHLLENGFGLLFGAVYFRDEKLYRKAAHIIRKELKEQILPDGGHYELSPMYHQIILFRVLDSYNLIHTQQWKKDEPLVQLLAETAGKMLSWLQEMTFTSGEIPYVNDAAPRIAPTSQELFGYAERLGLKALDLPLNESGYRKFNTQNYELLCDAGQIAPSYQPGHSHADNLSFVLHVNGKPVCVDTGISTYEKNERRQLERSTVSHNTVTVNGENSSQVWGGFRVGRRAQTTILKENAHFLEASHNGYQHLGTTHTRSFKVAGNEITITDRLSNHGQGVFHLHLYPECEVEATGRSTFTINNSIELIFHQAKQVDTEEYFFADGFNRLRKAVKIIVLFKEELKAGIRINR